MPIREEIKKALLYLDKNWPKQNNKLDASTKFIYTCKTLEELRSNSIQIGIDFNYALHRWYNFNCAKIHEDFFIQNGAVKEKDFYHKTIDFYLFNTPFDLKTTYFPKAIRAVKEYDLNSRKGKNNLIRWLYENQSQQGRFHLENRLFIVCTDLASKSNFEKIETNVKNFILFSKENGLNKIHLNHKEVCSDLIWIGN